MLNLTSFLDKVREGRTQVPVTISSKKWHPFNTYCKVYLKGPYENGSKMIGKPP